MSDYSELVAYWREEEKYTLAHGGVDDATKHYAAMCGQAANAIEALMRKVEVANKLAAILIDDDHKRGCEGRFYTCECGYDDSLFEAADALQKMDE